MRRLSFAALDSLPAGVRPPVDPRELGVGVVHLGVGAFHRAHQATYTQAAIAASGEPGWGICGASQRSAVVVEQLGPQDGLYTVVERGARTGFHVQAALREVLFAVGDVERLLERIAAPATHVVTLTVTEKGYRHDPASRRLRVDDPDIRADAAGRPPRTVPGQLVRGLQRRQRSDGGPLGVVSCDNLPSNGPTLRGLVEQFCGLLPAAEREATLAWVAGNVTFPATMVDRIVPATTPADLDDVAAAIGWEDRGAVVTEPFRQWVIEDRFCAPRPPWELAGAILTTDVAPYETMKLRLLNGAHSALAYLGLLAGYEYVADLVGVDGVAAYVRALMDLDATPTLDVPASFDVTRYKDELRDRFGNHALRHRTAQIGMDGSQKLPQRLLDTIRERRAAGAMPRFAALGVAAWMRFVSVGADERGGALHVDDPLAAIIATRLAGASGPAQVVDALLGLDNVFGPDLRDDLQLRALLVECLESLAEAGALAAVAAAVRG